jgi:hypothetical protein
MTGRHLVHRAEPLRVLTLVALLLLIAQFLVGMAVNLFVQIPDDHPGARPREYLGGSVQSVSWAFTSGELLWLAVHIVIGLLLLLTAVVLLLAAIRSGGGQQVAVTAFGLLGVVDAGLNGVNFLDFHEDLSSMAMSVGLAIALAAYSWGLYLSGRSRASTPGSVQ